MFKFNFGNKPPTIKQYVIVGLILSSIVFTVSQCTKVPEDNLWDWVDEIQRNIIHNPAVNDYIIKDPRKLQRRVERDVDTAIRQVTPEYDRIIHEADRVYQPRYIESPVDKSLCYSDECKSLGGEIRICAPWAIGCPDQNQN